MCTCLAVASNFLLRDERNEERQHLHDRPRYERPHHLEVPAQHTFLKNLKTSPLLNSQHKGGYSLPRNLPPFSCKLRKLHPLTHQQALNRDLQPTMSIAIPQLTLAHHPKSKTQRTQKNSRPSTNDLVTPTRPSP